MKFDTQCTQGAYVPKNGDPRVLPLVQSTTFAYETPEQLANIFDLKDPGYMYTRLGNPTVNNFEEKIAMMEGGAGALATSSGQAATLLAILNVCNCGDNIVMSSKVYGGTFNLLNVTLRRMGIDCRFVDPYASQEEIEKLIDEDTKMLFGETIANPAMVVFDFDKWVAIGKKYNILVAVDNTLATPCLCRPFEHGANIVLHSTTKYLDGHASCVGGMIVEAGNFDFAGNTRYPDFNEPDESYHGMVYSNCGKTAFVTKARVQLLRDLGTTMSPFNAYLTNMNSETLHLRMPKHSENALAVAQALLANDRIEWVRYPGLESDPAYAMANKYYLGKGFGGMMTFGVKGGREGANEVMKRLKLAKIVTHVADARTCVLHPASTTHRQLSSEQLVACGISDNLIRLSVGIEDVQDIIDDLTQALNF